MIVGLFAVSTAALAYPTSINLIPSADTMGDHSLRLELEMDSHPTPLASGAGLQLCTQLGVSNRLEIGFDVFDINLDADYWVNAKWQAIPETDNWPMVAIGLMDLASSSPLSNWYVVGSKDLGSFRVHSGLLHDDQTRAIVGVEHYWSEHTGVLADWTTGPSAYATLGIYHEVNNEWSTLLYYARDNSSQDDFVGLNLAWEGGW